MSKFRYIAPAVVAAGTAAATLAPAGQALAASHADGCGAVICLWYSSGYDSAIWRTDSSCAYPDFSADSCEGGVKDVFHSGIGNGARVRNDAHSMGNSWASYDWIWSKPYYSGPHWVEGPDNGVAKALPTSPPLRNNEASYFMSSVK